MIQNPLARLIQATTLLALLLIGPAFAAAQTTRPAVGAPVLFLVRHAETAPDGTRNPPLSAEGLERAQRLAEMLANAGLDRIYTTDYLRTRTTAAAVAEAMGQEPELYDPRDLPGFAELLRRRGERALVVGHSNTTPALVEALAGEPGTPIAEDEHERLYVVILDPAGTRTALLRY